MVASGGHVPLLPPLGSGTDTGCWWYISVNPEIFTNVLVPDTGCRKQTMLIKHNIKAEIITFPNIKSGNLRISISLL